MFSPSGRYAVVLTEKFIITRLRAELERVGFSLIPNQIQRFCLHLGALGMRNCFRKICWDVCFCSLGSKEKKLVLARDRFGEKPLTMGGKEKVFLDQRFNRSKNIQIGEEIEGGISFLAHNYNYIPAQTVFIVASKN